METSTIIWIIVVIVVIVVVALIIAALMRKKRTEQRRHQAEQIRREAVTHAPAIQDSELRAREAELEADRARLEAERAQARADEAARARAMDQAHYEDRVREADRLDPDVDHKSPDYYPSHPDPLAHGDDRPEGESRR